MLKMSANQETLNYERWTMNTNTIVTSLFRVHHSSFIAQSSALHSLRPYKTAFLSIMIQVFCILALSGTLAFAVPMQNDPNGFEGIPWGAAFSETDTFVKVEDAGRAQTYELKTGAPALGPAKVDSMRFLTVDGKFARVTVR